MWSTDTVDPKVPTTGASQDAWCVLSLRFVVCFLEVCFRVWSLCMFVCVVCQPPLPLYRSYRSQQAGAATEPKCAEKTAVSARYCEHVVVVHSVPYHESHLCGCRGEGGVWAPRTRKRHQQEHWPQRPTESSDPTQHAKGRTGDRPGHRKEATTRRNVTQGG